MRKRYFNFINLFFITFFFFLYFPAVLVGYFNMSLKKIKTYISNNFPNWSDSSQNSNSSSNTDSYSLGRLERLILFLPMTLFLILKIISIIIYTCSFLVGL
ncbi:hypothetical protein H8356DRAFT_397735 [Neocallimastix lanati (nom. inval.)]|nr:hypothetical protein H8356DRAFT_397735 [Neocallimastix sp. JGI-2020a]